MRIRFTLKRFLLFFAILAVFLVTTIRPAIIRNRARTRITELGGSFKSADPDTRYWRIVSQLLGESFQQIGVVSLDAEVNATDKELMFLAQLPEVHSLSIEYSDNTDNLFVPLIRNMKNLWNLSLDGTLAGDNTAEALAKYKSTIHYISLSQTNVSPAAADKVEDHFSTNFIWSQREGPSLAESLGTMAKLESRTKRVIVTEFGLDDDDRPMYDICLKTKEMTAAEWSAVSGLGRHASTLHVFGGINGSASSALASLDHVEDLYIGDTTGDTSWISELDSLQTIRVFRVDPKTDFFRFMANPPLDLGMIIAEHGRVTPSDLRHFSTAHQLKHLSFRYVGMDDEACAKLGDLSSLVELKLQGTPIGDAGLAHFSGLINLERLDLQNTKITDAGIQHLSRLEKLERLSLDRTQITDACVDYLVKLRNLERLSISDTKITLKGYERLVNMPSMRKVEAKGTEAE